MYFDPYEYGNYVDPPETHRKKTCLWGYFDTRLVKNPAVQDDVIYNKQNPWFNKVGGKSFTTKNFRSATAKGFAIAFFNANR